MHRRTLSAGQSPKGYSPVKTDFPDLTQLPIVAEVTPDYKKQLWIIIFLMLTQTSIFILSISEFSRIAERAKNTLEDDIKEAVDSIEDFTHSFQNITGLLDEFINRIT